MNATAPEDLLQEALAASQRGDAATAVELLERLHAQRPDARAAYLLGAEHAQRGAYEQAEAFWREAVRLDPSLGTAHLQLGLLLLTQGRVDDAESAWHGLDPLPPDHPLQHFRTGLQHLARDEFAACLDALGTGMAANTGNAALNSDMQRIAERVQEVLAAAAAAAPAGGEEDTADHLFLAAYRGDAGGPTRH